MFIDAFNRPLSEESLAPELRRDLEAAGVDRKELLTPGTNRQPIRVHDLRGTFVTLSFANNRTESWVADRAGHKSSQMLNRYRRAARTAKELGLGELQPMRDAIPELQFLTIAPDDESADDEDHLNYSESFGTPEGTRTPDRRVRKAPYTSAADPTSRDRSSEGDEQDREKAPSGVLLGNGSEADAVEAALAQALTAASAVGQWETVGQLARELEARRRGRLEVVDLASERAKRWQR